MKKYLFKILILIWMIIVFGFSNQPSAESSKLSGGLTEKIIKILHLTDKMSDQTSKQFIEKTETIIRKLAHFSLYTVGGILIFLEINQIDINFKRKVLYSQVIGSGYAITDEIHQLLVQGRSCETRDVFIDSLGIITGIIIVLIILIKSDKERKNY